VGDLSAVKVRNRLDIVTTDIFADHHPHLQLDIQKLASVHQAK
jgi:hypothetical protein